jgi:hypothetical protein
MLTRCEVAGCSPEIENLACHMQLLDLRIITETAREYALPRPTAENAAPMKR